VVAGIITGGAVIYSTTGVIAGANKAGASATISGATGAALFITLRELFFFFPLPHIVKAPINPAMQQRRRRNPATHIQAVPLPLVKLLLLLLLPLGREANELLPDSSALLLLFSSAATVVAAAVVVVAV